MVRLPELLSVTAQFLPIAASWFFLFAARRLARYLNEYRCVSLDYTVAHYFTLAIGIVIGLVLG